MQNLVIELTSFERDLLRVDLIRTINHFELEMQKYPKVSATYQAAIDVRQTLLDRIEHELGTEE